MTSEVINWITGITALGGGLFLLWQLGEHRRAQRAELGHLYVQRYWEIDDARLYAADEPEEVKQRRRYLRLFEDEFDARRLRFLDRKQWKAWHGYLDDQQMLAGIRKALAECDPEEVQFHLLRACVTQREKNSTSHPYWRCDGTRRRWTS